MFTIRADLREVRSGVVAMLNGLMKSGEVARPGTFEVIPEVLTVGDYIIECGGYVLIIERKSISDLAASIVDRRIYENHEKLLDAASSDNGLRWRIMYLVEGRQFTPRDAKKKVNGIYVANLRAKLDHLMMQDGCQIEWTRDAKHTAARIVELGKNMITIKGGTPSEEKKVDVGAIVKKKYEKTERQIQLEMLTCISGVGPVTAERMLSHHNFGDIVTGNFVNNVPTKAADEIKEMVAGNRRAVEKNMLTKVKGMSTQLADIILEATSIYEFDADIAADLKRSSGRRIGNAITDRIKKTIDWTEPSEEEDDADSSAE